MSSLLNCLFAKRWQLLHTKERELALAAKIEDYRLPGVYLIAYSSKSLARQPVKPVTCFMLECQILPVDSANAFGNSNHPLKGPMVTVPLIGFTRWSPSIGSILGFRPRIGFSLWLPCRLCVEKERG
jgi:hypothetical protein